MTPLARWGAFWENLSPATIACARELCRDDLRFIDPFNDLTGIDRLEALLVHLFQTAGNPRFVVEDLAMGNRAGYLRWRFQATIAGRPIMLDGMSEVRFEDGKVSLHRDHWDAGAQVYGRVPVLGAAIRLIRSRLSLPA